MPDSVREDGHGVSGRKCARLIVSGLQELQPLAGVLVAADGLLKASLENVLESAEDGLRCERGMLRARALLRSLDRA